jgi:hypothetical protein
VRASPPLVADKSLTKTGEESPKLNSTKFKASPKHHMNLDLEALQKSLDQDFNKPFERDEAVNQNIEVYTKKFEEKIDDIVENDTFMAGFRNVEAKRNRNPNSLSMF